MDRILGIEPSKYALLVQGWGTRSLRLEVQHQWYQLYMVLYILEMQVQDSNVRGRRRSLRVLFVGWVSSFFVILRGYRVYSSLC